MDRSVNVEAYLMSSGINLRSASSPEADAYIERLIFAMQQAIAEVTAAPDVPLQIAAANAPYIADALLCVLASIVEQDPACSTPSALRKASEEYGRTLHHLMKSARQLRLAEADTARITH